MPVTCTWVDMGISLISFFFFSVTERITGYIFMAKQVLGARKNVFKRF